MARLCQPGGKANEGAGGVREREVFPGLTNGKKRCEMTIPLDVGP